MTDQVSAPRSRRALLAAAAGGAAALAASAAMPLTMAAHDTEDVGLNIVNGSTSTTTIADSTIDDAAFVASATGTGTGVGGSSTGGFGVLGWSISAPAFLQPSDGAYTGILGWAPGSPTADTIGVGVQGISDDFGVYGSGNVGVYGFGTFGIIGESGSTAAGVTALARSSTDLALDVRGKVKFSRSGRSAVAAGHATKTVTVAGVTSSSMIMALMQTNRSSRWVRAVVPASGKFTIYLNASVSSTTYVAWFILN
jgi:hypothetical protein